MKWATTWGSSTPGGPLLFGPNSTTNPTLSWKTRAPSDPWNVGREGATAEGDGGGTGLLFDEHGPGEQSEKGGRTSPNPHRDDTVDLWPTRHQHPSSGTVWWGGVGWGGIGKGKTLKTSFDLLLMFFLQMFFVQSPFFAFSESFFIKKKEKILKKNTVIVTPSRHLKCIFIFICDYYNK